MKASNMFAPTLREVPAEAEIISHKLMLVCCAKQLQAYILICLWLGVRFIKLRRLCGRKWTPRAGRSF